ncbi:MAG: hypothetical protein HFI86_08975 [Bacilli bacterium]|nr:hypothetical protein [Bacilli bacterium]
MSEDKRNLDESFMFAAFDDEESLEETGNLLKKYCDGEPVNKDPLIEIPIPDMVLYHIHGHYFDELDDLKEYCSSEGISSADFDIVCYLRFWSGRSDVIMKVDHDNKFIFWTAVDEDGYSMYNIERSMYRGEFVWEYNHGNINYIYKPFRDRGIVFQNDIYAKIDRQNQALYEYCKKYKLFNYK